jgi:hypothetical protein
MTFREEYEDPGTYEAHRYIAHWVKDAVEKRQIILHHTPTDEQIAGESIGQDRRRSNAYTGYSKTIRFSAGKNTITHTSTSRKSRFRMRSPRRPDEPHVPTWPLRIPSSNGSSKC